jgi:iron complex outermembrane receptor protein
MRRGLAAVALCALSPAAGADADADTSQAPPPVELQEVIVTAERVHGVLRRTPVSVGVLERREMDAKGIAQLNDLVGVIAGVAVPNGYSNMPQAVGIRGVGVSIPAMHQAVGIYIDDVPLIRGYATALWDLPDIERIEVLRGPQGTLYGQNLTAGAVKFVSMNPTRDGAAWASLSAGNRGAFELHGYASGPLGPGPLAASLALSRRSNHGFGYNASQGQRVNRLDATQLRAKLRYQDASGLDVVLAVDALQDRSDANTTNFPLNDPRSAPRVTFTTADAGAFKRLAGGLSLHIAKPLSQGIVLRSITAYRAFKDDPTVADWGGLAVQRFTLSQIVEQRALSQELQLQATTDRLTWTSGVMVVRDRFDFTRFTTSVALAAPAAVHAEADTGQTTLDAGLYSQARLAVTPGTAFTLGARAYRTRQRASNAFWRTDAGFHRTVQVYSAPDLSVAKSGVLPRLGIERQWNEDLLSYLSVAQGAKFAGFNRAAQSLLAASFPADPEKVTTYEAGIKLRTADHRVSASAALFFNDYRDYLVSLMNTTINGVLVTDAVLVNAARARTHGIDLEAAARLTRDVDWNLSVELLRSRFTEFDNPTGSAASGFVGRQLPFAPRLTLGSSLRYRRSLAALGTLSGELSIQHIGSQYTDVANSSALQIPRQTYLNGGLLYKPADRRWSVSLRIKNILDRTHVLGRNIIAPLGVDAAFYNAPRTFLVTLRHDF